MRFGLVCHLVSLAAREPALSCVRVSTTTRTRRVPAVTFWLERGRQEDGIVCGEAVAVAALARVWCDGECGRVIGGLNWSW